MAHPMLAEQLPIERGERCLRCSAIDFPALLGDDSKLYTYDFPSPAESRSCPVCKLFLRCHQIEPLLPFGSPPHGRIRNIPFRGVDGTKAFSRIVVPTVSGETIGLDPVELQQRAKPFQFGRRPLGGQVDRDMLHSWFRNYQYQSDVATDLSASDWFRLIDVTQARVIKAHPRRYLALSYVWGDAISIYPRKKLLEDDGFLHLTSLPRTIRDAIELTHILGETYLWIDFLCIDQSSHAETEWIVPRINLIYANAACTIVAAAGTDADAGLPGLWPGSRAPETLTGVSVGADVAYFLPSRPDISRLIKASKWITRGWTLQEHVLSGFCLFFTNSEAFCTSSRHGMKREAYEHWHGLHTPWVYQMRAPREVGIPQHIKHCLDRDAHQLYQYAQLVEEFSARDLRYSSDIVAAFGGVLSHLWEASELGPFYMSTGIALLWQGLSLLWSSHRSSIFGRRVSKANAGENFPSWSWVGWKGRVRYDLFHTERRQWWRGSKKSHWYAYLKPHYDNRPKNFLMVVQRLLQFTIFDGIIVGVMLDNEAEQDTMDQIQPSRQYGVGDWSPRELRDNHSLRQAIRSPSTEILLRTSCIEVGRVVLTPGSEAGSLGLSESMVHIDSDAELSRDRFDQEQQVPNLALLACAKVQTEKEYTFDRTTEVMALVVSLDGLYAERIGIACVTASE